MDPGRGEPMNVVVSLDCDDQRCCDCRFKLIDSCNLFNVPLVVSQGYCYRCRLCKESEVDAWLMKKLKLG